VLQWLFTEPEQGVFNWTEGEIVSQLAEEQDKILRCHALVWHSQLAPWVEEVEWTPETLTDAIKLHIQKVAGHWKGRCYAWDVVNEALEEDGSWRESVFYKVLGEDYIKIAFAEAAKVDPEAKLYYNDYNLERPSAKSRAAVDIVRMLQDDGIKIDGVGMQAHTIAGRSPSIDDYIAVIDMYAETGVEVALTELDIRIVLPLNETNLEWQKQDYRAVSTIQPTSGHHSGSIANKIHRLSVAALSLPLASVSPSGTSTTPSAGFPTSSRARVPLSSGSTTSPCTLPTTAPLPP
jgi:endo-1,4-beta-xylanase